MGRWVLASLIIGLAGCSSALEDGYKPHRLGSSDAVRRSYYASPFTPGCKTIAVISTAARYARRTSMHPQVAAAMLADYIVRGEPI